MNQLQKYANGVGSSLVLDYQQRHRDSADSAPAVQARENGDVVSDQQYQEAMNVVNRYHRQKAIPEQANIEDLSTKYHWLCALFGLDPTHYKVYSHELPQSLVDGVKYEMLNRLFG